MTGPRRIAVTVLGLLLAVWAMIVHTPVYLPPVTPQMQAARADTPQTAQRVFGFATLTSPLVRFVVVGRPVPTQAAGLADFQREGRDILPQAGTVLSGQVFTVTPDELLRLDRYERLGTRYRRDPMVLEDGAMAWVYSLMEQPTDGR